MSQGRPPLKMTRVVIGETMFCFRIGTFWEWKKKKPIQITPTKHGPGTSDKHSRFFYMGLPLPVEDYVLLTPFNEKTTYAQEHFIIIFFRNFAILSINIFTSWESHNLMLIYLL